MDIDLSKELIEEDPSLTIQRLAGCLEWSHITVEACLHELDKTWKYGVWISHDLSPHQFQHRVDTCMELMTSH